MKDNVLLQTIAGAVITTGLTLFGTALLQKSQNDAAERLKFLDGAQSTAQETSKLLAQGYRALQDLRENAGAEGFENYSKGPRIIYNNFYREWRQALIDNQFKVIRYFGKDVANNIIHIDEIDKVKVDNRSSPNPCSAPGSDESYDMNKIAGQVQCYVQFTSLLNDSLHSDNADTAQSFIEDIGRKSSYESDIRSLIENYEVSYVKVLRTMDDRFTQLGANKVTVVLRD